VAVASAFVFTGCGTDANDMAESKIDGSATIDSPGESTPGTPASCHEPPSASVTGGNTISPMTLIVYEESTPQCGQNVDGEAMVDPLFRPGIALVAPDGNIRVTVDALGEVVQDVQTLEPTTAIGSIKPKTLATADNYGKYPVTMPGTGCFVVTIGWQAEGRRAQFASLMESAPGLCGAD
jgi:hypothetical protein